MKKNKPIFIAEIKTQSPFGFKSEKTFYELAQLAIQYGDWISVHVDALWGGDYNTINFVRNLTDKPILAKGLHSRDDDIIRSLDHGASYVLVVDRIPVVNYDIREKILFEFSNINTVQHLIARVESYKNLKYVANSRDLKNGCVDRENKKIDQLLELGVWTCQASGIHYANYIKPNIDAFIVGENLPEFCNDLDNERWMKERGIR